MPVHIVLSTTLRDYVPGYQPAKGMEMEPGGFADASELAVKIGLPLEEIKIVMINGRKQPLDTPIRDGDRVAYFPAVGGG